MNQREKQIIEWARSLGYPRGDHTLSITVKGANGSALFTASENIVNIADAICIVDTESGQVHMAPEPIKEVDEFEEMREALYSEYLADEPLCKVNNFYLNKLAEHEKRLKELEK